MTPEEKAVIQAAIEWRMKIPGHDIHEVIALQEATWKLITSCSRCNEGGHTCPGDGKWIAHGETDCGEHNDPHQAEVERAFDGDAEDRVGDTEPSWWIATFADLLPGDKVRIGTSEATVTKVNRGRWHAKDRQWVDDAGKVRDHVTPWEHEELRIDLTANPGMHVYPPDTACEILADTERAAVLALQAGFPGTSSVVNWSA